MPSPKNRMKSTGDTHLPEVEYETPTRFDDAALRMYDADETEEEEPARYAAPRDAVGAVEQAARSNPLMALGVVLAAGYLFAKLLRR
jgi:hypothetical protein